MLWALNKHESVMLLFFKREKCNKYYMSALSVLDDKVVGSYSTQGRWYSMLYHINDELQRVLLAEAPELTLTTFTSVASMVYPALWNTLTKTEWI